MNTIDNKGDFSRIKKAHFVGIKGVAMSALAVWAKEKGIVVTGSDVEERFPTDDVLRRADIHPFVGFYADHLSDNSRPDVVIYTGAHGGVDNIEVKTAIHLGISVFAHGKALGMAMRDKKQISIGGSHGKTTTSAMIATVLMVSGEDPSYAIGCGEIGGLGLPGHAGNGEYFVAEADEYITDPTHDRTPRFLWQNPNILVVTNIDFDHPDAYRSLADVQKAFLALQNQQQGVAVTIVNADDPASVPLRSKKTRAHIITYGFSANADYRISDVQFSKERTQFTLHHGDWVIRAFQLRIPGRHNAYNAAAAAVACQCLGISWDDIAHGLLRFTGTKRRFEKIGEAHRVIYYDDYAHHPKEIQATLSAARAWYPKHRIVAIFQPHTYSRTKVLLLEFAQSFSDADIVVTTDIYPSARETDTLGIDGMTLSREIMKYHDHVFYAPSYPDVLSHCKKQLNKSDIVIFMGAGNIYTWGRDIYKELQ